MPWLGYFDLIDQVDVFVVLDSVQFEKQSWQQRNRIKAPTGLQWLTVPVVFRGRLGQTINEVEIREHDFWNKHLRAIELNYRRAPFFEAYFSELRETFELSTSSQLLVDLNLRLLAWFLNKLGLSVQMRRSSKMGLQGKRTQLLANILRALGASEYLSPIGSADYLLSELKIMDENGISVFFQHYEHPEYRQMFPPFLPYASALDLLFNEGENSLEILRRGRRNPYSPNEVSRLLAAKAEV